MSTHGQAWDRSRSSAVCPLSNRLRDGMGDRPGRKFEQYHSTSAEVKNVWSYVSSSSIRRHGVDMAAICFP
jgi:hypothetical protein